MGAHLYVSLTLFVVVEYISAALCQTINFPVGVFMPVFMVGAAFGRLVGESMFAWFPSGFGKVVFIFENWKELSESKSGNIFVTKPDRESITRNVSSSCSWKKSKRAYYSCLHEVYMISMINFQYVSNRIFLVRLNFLYFSNNVLLEQI